MKKADEERSSIKHGNSLAIKITHSIASMHLKMSELCVELIKAIKMRVCKAYEVRTVTIEFIYLCESMPVRVNLSPFLLSMIVERDFKFHFH
jgi:hypothetical protein